MEVRKCLRQQLKDFYATGFETWVKLWDMRINVGGGYVDFHSFYVLYPFVTYLLTPVFIFCTKL
jgi:hypothetical protein